MFEISKTLKALGEDAKDFRVFYLTPILDKRGLGWHGLGGAVLGRDFQRCAGGEGIPKSHKM